MKVCCGCKKSLGTGDFHRSFKASDGLKTQCKQCVKIQSQARYSKKKEHILLCNKAWRSENGHKYAEYRETHRVARRVAHSKRRAAEKERTVPWACDELIKRHYEYAKIMEDTTGEAWHVDHVVPLLGKEVSGLHVHNNLQVIRASENLSKGNQFGGGQ